MKRHVWTHTNIWKFPVEVFANMINAFNQQSVSLIALWLSSEWLDCLSLPWFTVQRYGIPMWARLCQWNKELAVFKSTDTLCYGAKCKPLWVKYYVQNAETCSKYRCYAQNTEMLIYIMLKSRNVHACSNSNFAIIHRAQDNSWTTENFWLIVLYVWPLVHVL